MSDDIRAIIYRLHPLERAVLRGDSLSEAELKKGVQLLEANSFAKVEWRDDVFVGLDKFGKKYVLSDLPEISLLREVISSKKKMSELSLDKALVGSALGVLKRNGLVDVHREGGEQVVIAKSSAKGFLKSYSNPLKLFTDDVLESELSSSQKKVFLEFSKRAGFLREFSKKNFSYSLTKKGERVSTEFKAKYSKLNLLEAVDSSMLKTQSWKGKEFRHYDVSLKAGYSNIGRYHPMLEANNILRDVFVEMGFSEMSGPMVESAFWNMDVMWIPQDHPARDEQDTFYLDGECDIPKNIASKVRKMHEIGIKKTHTQTGEWSYDIAKKRLLRTHSTATSFRTLHELGKRLKKGEDINGKYFYIACNFRNEAIDATHLAEFYQAEGFIVGDDLSLADLMGFISMYYSKLGIKKIKFKPTFNPYTEPSMEAHYYDPKMKKWYALINSGIFRKETLEPLGLGDKIIIAWGMGASRVATLLCGKSSMREITGATCDLEWLKNREMMRREIVR